MPIIVSIVIMPKNNDIPAKNCRFIAQMTDRRVSIAAYADTCRPCQKTPLCDTGA